MIIAKKFCFMSEPHTVEKGEIYARRSLAASSVTGVSDTGATFPKGAMLST